ncbi:MAG: hypothetical protein LLG04_06040 [Parachlamydia sp.]|nr:hypothetical protein [Parachlamydia sp.]
MLAVKQSDVGLFANKSAGTLQCHASRGLGELKDVALEVLDTGLGALGFNTPSKEYEKNTSEFQALSAMHKQIQAGLARRSGEIGQSETFEDAGEKIAAFNKPSLTMLTNTFNGTERSRAKLEAIHQRLSDLKGEIRDAKREVGLAMVTDEQAAFKLEKAKKELKNATDQSKPHTKGKEGTMEDAEDHLLDVKKSLEDKKAILKKKKEEMRQLEQDLPKATSEFSQRLELLESAIKTVSKETNIPVQRPLTTGDKVEAKLKEVKGKAEEAKNAAVRLAGKVAEPVGTFVLEQYTKVEELAESLGTKADDLAAEQKEKKQLSEFNRRCDVKIRELEAKIQRDPKSDPVVQDVQEKVGQVVHQLFPEAERSEQFSSLFDAFNQHPSKESFQKLMNTNENLWHGLAMRYGSYEKATTAAIQFYEATASNEAITKLKNEKVEAEQAFFHLQRDRELYRFTDAKYQKNKDTFRADFDNAAENYIESRNKFNELMGS